MKHKLLLKNTKCNNRSLHTWRENGFVFSPQSKETRGLLVEVLNLSVWSLDVLHVHGFSTGSVYPSPSPHSIKYWRTGVFLDKCPMSTGKIDFCGQRSVFLWPLRGLSLSFVTLTFVVSVTVRSFSLHVISSELTLSCFQTKQNVCDSWDFSSYCRLGKMPVRKTRILRSCIFCADTEVFIVDELHNG